MAVPNTYLRTAPGDLEQTFGQGIMSATLIEGLQRINPQIRIPMPEHFTSWYPAQKEGVTCLWLGTPGVGKKLCALRLGLIPEWTQLDADGQWMIRGWRSVFERVMRMRAATARQIEAQFHVVLETDGEDGSCVDCRREGHIRVAEGQRRCAPHRSVKEDAEKRAATARYVAEQAKLLTNARQSRRAEKEIQECLST
jgi:hypothetical protein